jgi:hypothetical protein
MKTRILLAISALALSVASEAVLAAETEVPAARERAAPARRQAQPARQAPAQQTASSSSFTGSQAGGYGGGNAGGGNFTDPFGVCAQGVNPAPTIPGTTCPAVPFAFSQHGKVTGTGGVSYGYSWMGPWGLIWGWETDIYGGKVKVSSTQSNVHSTAAFDGFGFTTAETYTGSLDEGTNGSLRLRIGAQVNNFMAVFWTVGVAIGEVGGSFAYSGSNFSPVFCPAGPFSTCSTNVTGAASWSHTLGGFTTGASAEFLTGIPNVLVVLDYRFIEYGGFSTTVPLYVTNCTFGAPALCRAGNAVITTDHLYTNRFVAGLKVKLGP